MKTLLMGYSAEVLDHFQNPRNAGELGGAAIAASAANPVCGDVLKLWVVVSAGVIQAASFKAEGCVPALACGSWLAAWLEGKEVAKVQRLTADKIDAALGGLPPASKHAAALAIAALAALRTQMEGKRNSAVDSA